MATIESSFLNVFSFCLTLLLTAPFVAESWTTTTSRRILLLAKRPISDAAIAGNRDNNKNVLVLKDLLNGEPQWYATADTTTGGSSPSSSFKTAPPATYDGTAATVATRTRPTTSSPSPFLGSPSNVDSSSRSAVERKLLYAAEAFIRYRSGYFSPMRPNDKENVMNAAFDPNGGRSGGGVLQSPNNNSNNINREYVRTGFKKGYMRFGTRNNNNSQQQVGRNNNNSNSIIGRDALGRPPPRPQRSSPRKRQQRRYYQYDPNDPTNILAEDFTFRSPVTLMRPLDKRSYVDFVYSARLYESFPDLDPNCYGFVVDVADPLTVRFYVKATGTYQRPLNSPSLTNSWITNDELWKSKVTNWIEDKMTMIEDKIKSNRRLLKEPDGRRYIGATESWSVTFNDLERMQIRSLTAGYVVDGQRYDVHKDDEIEDVNAIAAARMTCTTGGKGLISGILYTVGITKDEENDSETSSWFYPPSSSKKAAAKAGASSLWSEKKQRWS